MMDEEIRLDIVEAKEAVDRALARLASGSPGSARVHADHALTVLERILARVRGEDR